MITANNFNTLIAPIISEKSNNLAENQGQVVFQVAKQATSSQVKKSFEAIFNVKVTKVNLLNVDGKVKKFKNILGKQSSYKKAYIMIAKGQDFDLNKIL